MTYLLFIVLLLTIANISFGIKLMEKHEWKALDYLWKNSTHKQNAINSGDYNASVCILLDVDMTCDGRTFVTVMSNKGVPATLATVCEKSGRLKPYPDWSWYNNNNNCGCRCTIISVYRVYIKCNYLFVLDNGVRGESVVCPPKLLIFNLKNNEPVKYIKIPSDVATNKNNTGLLVTVVVHIQDCRYINYATVFMADVDGRGLVIYNNYLNKFCRIESDFMQPTDPVFTINNQSFYLADGILGLTTIGPNLYHASLAGHNIFSIYMGNLECMSSNLEYAKCSNLSKSEANSLTKLVGTLSGQTGPIASAHHVIFFSNLPKTAIQCADATKEFNSNNSEIISQDSEKLQFISGLKVSNCGRKLLIATDRLQRYMTNTLNLNEINFRILEISMEQILKETKCFASHNNW